MRAGQSSRTAPSTGWRPTHVCSLTTSAPNAHTHDGAKTRLSPPVFLPMVEPPVTPWMGDAVDSKGVTPWVPSPRRFLSDSQGPSQHAGGRARAGQSVWEREGSPGDSRAGRPQAPCSPSLPVLQLGRGGPDSCLALWLLWALERLGLDDGRGGELGQHSPFLSAVSESAVTGQS